MKENKPSTFDPELREIVWDTLQRAPQLAATYTRQQYQDRMTACFINALDMDASGTQPPFVCHDPVFIINKFTSVCMAVYDIGASFLPPRASAVQETEIPAIPDNSTLNILETITYESQ